MFFHTAGTELKLSFRIIRLLRSHTDFFHMKNWNSGVKILLFHIFMLILSRNVKSKADSRHKADVRELFQNIQRCNLLT